MKKLKKIFITFMILIILMSICVHMLYFLYPRKYESIVNRYASQYNISPKFVWAVIKAESNFDPYARSRKDAVGLMQITEPTGAWIAERLHIKNYKKEQLYNPDINIKMGCWYIKNLFEQYNNVDTALAAYNGGSGNVDKWLQDKEYSDDGKVIKKIPFEETRKYVEKIKFNEAVYKILY